MANVRLKSASDGRIYKISLPSDIRPNRFKDFYQQMFFGLEKIRHKEEVDVKEAARRWRVDKESAFKYLEFMKKHRWFFHIKTQRDRAVWKIYIAGCSPDEESKYIRGGLIDWASDLANKAVRNFFERHPRYYAPILRRLYMRMEYDEPFFPKLAQKFPRLARRPQRSAWKQ